MDAVQHLSQVMAMMMGAAWASGINLYAAILVLGGMGALGQVSLPADLTLITHPMVLSAAGLMYIIEFITDKIPGIDTAWDALHTFIRIPAGALLAAGTVGKMDPGWMLAAGLVGGTLTTGTHAAKAGSRVLINASPEPFSNWIASVSEDVAVFAGLWAALRHPILFLVLLGVFILMLVWLLPRLWRGIRKLGGAIAGLFRKKVEAPPSSS
jgi:hypothetical protein